MVFVSIIEFITWIGIYYDWPQKRKYTANTVDGHTQAYINIVYVTHS